MANFEEMSLYLILTFLSRSLGSKSIKNEQTGEDLLAERPLRGLTKGTKAGSDLEAQHPDRTTRCGGLEAGTRGTVGLVTTTEACREGRLPRSCHVQQIRIRRTDQETTAQSIRTQDRSARLVLEVAQGATDEVRRVPQTPLVAKADRIHDPRLVIARGTFVPNRIETSRGEPPRIGHLITDVQTELGCKRDIVTRHTQRLPAPIAQRHSALKLGTETERKLEHQTIRSRCVRQITSIVCRFLSRPHQLTQIFLSRLKILDLTSLTSLTRLQCADTTRESRDITLELKLGLENEFDDSILTVELGEAFGHRTAILNESRDGLRMIIDRFFQSSESLSTSTTGTATATGVRPADAPTFEGRIRKPVQNAESFALLLDERVVLVFRLDFTDSVAVGIQEEETRLEAERPSREHHLTLRRSRRLTVRDLALDSLETDRICQVALPAVAGESQSAFGDREITIVTSRRRTILVHAVVRNLPGGRVDPRIRVVAVLRPTISRAGTIAVVIAVVPAIKNTHGNRTEDRGHRKCHQTGSQELFHLSTPPKLVSPRNWGVELLRITQTHSAPTGTSTSVEQNARLKTNA